MRILVLGGYGVFGGRLVHLIADLAGVEILVAGRDAAAARSFCAGWSGTAGLRPLVLDRAHTAAAIAGENPDLIVDASGPFQSYGSDPYCVVRAAIAASVNYLDFADSPEFVMGIRQFDAEAKERGVYVLSGVSSFPVLTAAVLRDMAVQMTLRRVTAGIAPSPHAGIGMNVMRAVIGYAGSPVSLRRGGRFATGIGLGESRRYTIAPPGEMPLPSRRFSLVDAPDLRIIPEMLPDLTDIWVGAGPVPEWLHRILNLMAGMRHALRLPSLGPLAPLCYQILNVMRFGPHRGGMFVEAEGERSGKAIRRSWHLVAEGEDGPLIPSMAIEAIIRKAMLANPPAPGARAAIHDLDLADYQILFRRREIRHGWREETADDRRALYPGLLLERFARLPPLVQRLHLPGDGATWRGAVNVTRGTGMLPAFIAWLFGFPRPGTEVPLTVTLATDADGCEIWTRQFDIHRMQSIQSAGKGRNRHLIVEKFGAFAIALVPVIRNGRLELHPRRWSVFGLPLPRALLPTGTTYETEADGAFRFHVEINLPLVGKIVHYEGWLKPC